MVSGWAIQRQPALEDITDDFAVDGKQLVGIAGGPNISVPVCHGNTSIIVAPWREDEIGDL